MKKHIVKKTYTSIHPYGAKNNKTTRVAVITIDMYIKM